MIKLLNELKMHLRPSFSALLQLLKSPWAQTNRQTTCNGLTFINQNIEENNQSLTNHERD